MHLANLLCKHKILRWCHDSLLCKTLLRDYEYNTIGCYDSNANVVFVLYYDGQQLFRVFAQAASLGNLKWYSFCLFVVVSQSLWRRVGWELPGYFRLIFHSCVTRFNNSVTHELSVTIRFILCETIIACFLLGRLFNSLTAGIVLVGKFWYVGSC